MSALCQAFPCHPAQLSPRTETPVLVERVRRRRRVRPAEEVLEDPGPPAGLRGLQKVSLPALDSQGAFHKCPETPPEQCCTPCSFLPLLFLLSLLKDGRTVAVRSHILGDQEGDGAPEEAVVPNSFCFPTVTGTITSKC